MAIELAGCMGVCLWPMCVYSMRDGWLHGGACLWPMFVYSMRDGYRVGWLHVQYKRWGYVWPMFVYSMREGYRVGLCMGGMFVYRAGWLQGG